MSGFLKMLIWTSYKKYINLLKTINITFGEPPRHETIKFTMLRVEDSLKFLLYLGKIFGGAMGSAISSVATGDASKIEKLSPKDFNLDSLGNNLSLLLGRIDEKETIEKINLLLSSVSHEGEVIDINSFIFDEGRLHLLFRFIKEAFMVNYKNFFYANKGLLEKIKKSATIIQQSTK